MHSHVISICIRVATTAEEVVYAVVAEPPEPQGQAPQQQEVCVEPAQGPANPSVEQQTQGKPRCTPFYFRIITPMIIFLLLPVH